MNRGELTARCRWTCWVRELSGQIQDFKERQQPFRVINSQNVPRSNNEKLSGVNMEPVGHGNTRRCQHVHQSVSETLGSSPIMPKNLPGHTDGCEFRSHQSAGPSCEASRVMCLKGYAQNTCQGHTSFYWVADLPVGSCSARDPKFNAWLDFWPGGPNPLVIDDGWGVYEKLVCSLIQVSHARPLVQVSMWYMEACYVHIIFWTSLKL